MVEPLFVYVAQICRMQGKYAKKRKKVIHIKYSEKMPEIHLYTKLCTLSTEYLAKNGNNFMETDKTFVLYIMEKMSKKVKK